MEKVEEEYINTLRKNMIHQLNANEIDKDSALVVTLMIREEYEMLQMIDYLKEHPQADSSQVLDKVISLHRHKGESNNEIYW